jgi:hypothetical protein
MYFNRKKYQLAFVVAAATVGILATGPLYSGSASAESCKPPPPIRHLAETAIAGRVYAGGGPAPPAHGSCSFQVSTLGAGGAVTLATQSGHVIETYYLHAGGVYRFAVRPGLYVVRASIDAGETSPPCQPKTVRIREHERKIVKLSCIVV